MISTLPVWNVLRVVPEWELPDWYVGPDQVPRPGPVPDRLARPLPRRRRAGARCSTGASSRPGCTRRPSRVSGLLVRADGAGPDDRARGQVPVRRAAGSSRARKARDERYLADEVREVRARHRDDVPGPGEADLAPPAPGLRAVLRRDPEARPRRHVPAALAGAERRRPLLRERDVPQPRDRRRPRLARRPDGRRGLPRQAPARASRRPGATDGRASGRTRRARHGRRAAGSARRSPSGSPRTALRSSSTTSTRTSRAPPPRRSRARSPRSGASPTRRSPTSSSRSPSASSATLDLVVNNAGITRDAMLHRMTDDEWDLVARRQPARHVQRLPLGGAAAAQPGGGLQPQGREHGLDQRHLRRRRERQLLGREGGRDRAHEGARARVGAACGSTSTPSRPATSRAPG